MSPPKITNSTITASNGERNEIPDKEFKSLVIRLWKEIKEDMNKLLNKFQENTNKQQNEIMDSMEDLKEEFNKENDWKKIKLKYSK